MLLTLFSYHRHLSFSSGYLPRIRGERSLMHATQLCHAFLVRSPLLTVTLSIYQSQPFSPALLVTFRKRVFSCITSARTGGIVIEFVCLFIAWLVSYARYDFGDSTSPILVTCGTDLQNRKSKTTLTFEKSRSKFISSRSQPEGSGILQIVIDHQSDRHLATRSNNYGMKYDFRKNSRWRSG